MLSILRATRGGASRLLLLALSCLFLGSVPARAGSALERLPHVPFTGVPLPGINGDTRAGDPLPTPLTPQVLARLRQAALDSKLAQRSGSRIEDLGVPGGTWTELNHGSIRLAFQSAIYDPVRARMLMFGGFDGTEAKSDVWELSLSGPPTWSLLSVAGPRPDGAYDHSAIYDPVRDRMIVYGGSSNSGALELWALSLSGTPSWTPMSASGSPPDPRSGHTAIYDPVRDRMIVFGGSTGSYVNEVWELTLSGSPTWTQLSTSGGPTGRYEHSAIYDPVRDQMVVFGGYEPDFTTSDETWALSLSSLEWNLIVPSGTPPSDRAGSEAIYDPIGDQMIVHGGNGSSGLSSDVFALSLSTSTWTQIVPDGASPPRYFHSSIYDPVAQQMIVMGGHDGSYMKDVYALSLSGTPTWTELPTILPPGPGGVGQHPAFVYDSVRDRLVIFGGYGASGYFTDVWALSLSGTPSWTQIMTTGDPPAARVETSAIYDPVRDRLVLFGGAGADYYNDVWELTLSGTPTWTQLTPAGTPPEPRAGLTTIYDPVRDQMVMFGGFKVVVDSRGNPRLVVMSDTWALSLSGSPAWTDLAPAGSVERLYDHAAIYDPVRDRMLVSGGNNGNAHGQLDDVWELTLASPEWTRLTTSGASPGPRQLHTAIYDPVGDRMLLFGGTSPSGFVNGTWQLALAGTPEWTQLVTSVGQPAARYGHAGVYDAAHERLVVFGGSGNGAYLEDSWAMSFGTVLPPALVLTETHTDVSTCGAADGSIDLTVTGGTPPYSYAWSNGATTEDVAGLVEGTDSVTVTDSFGGSAGLRVTIAGPTPVVSATHLDATCGDDSTGAIDLTVTGGVPPYTFAWSNGASTEDLTGLPPGIYSVTVTDMSGCAASRSDTVAAPRYTVTATAGTNGSITPLGAMVVDCGADAAFVITPDPDYMIDELLVDGEPMIPTFALTLHHVTANHAVSVTFRPAVLAVDTPPVEFALGTITPNPVRGVLRTRFGLPTAGAVRLSVVDLQGREICVVAEGAFSAGWHEVAWNGRGARDPVSAGVYFLRYRGAGRSIVRRFVLVR